MADNRAAGRMSTPVRFAVVLALALPSLTVAGTGPDSRTGLEAALDADPGLVAAIESTDPFAALADLGFSDFTQRLIPLHGIRVINAQEYAFGDDPTGEPVLDVPGTRLAAMGWLQVSFDAAPVLSQGEVDDRVYLTNGAGIVPDTPYVLMWARYQDAYDFAALASFANRGFVTAIPGVPLWEPSFAGDVWGGGYHMPALLSDDQGQGRYWYMEMTRYQPDDPALFLAVEFDGFALLEGDLLVIGVATADLMSTIPAVSSLVGSTPTIDAVRLGYFGHERPYGTTRFTPGHLTTYPMVPGRTYDSLLMLPEGIARDFVVPSYFSYAPPVAVTTTTTPAVTTTTTAPASDTPDSGGSFPWVLILIVALVLGGTLWWRLRGGTAASSAESKGPCGDRYDRWQFYQRLCDDERAAVEGWESARADRLRHLKERLGSLEDWQSAERGQIEQQISESEGGAAPDRSLLDRLCAQAAEARAEYDECVRQAAAPPTPPAAPQPAPPQTSGGGTGGPTVSGAPPQPEGTRTRPCPDGAIRNGRTSPGYPKSIYLVVGYDVRMVSEGVRFQGSAEDADRLGQSMDELAEDLANLAEGKLPGTLGELQDLKSTLEDAHGKVKDVVEKGAAEAVRSELSTRLDGLRDEVNAKIQSGIEEAAGIPYGEIKDAASKVPEMMRNPAKAALEILRFTADLASKVAKFSGRVIRGGDLYRLEVWVQRTQIDFLWQEYEKCVKGRWVKAYQVLCPGGPTRWHRERVVNNVPGPNHSGPAFGRAIRDLERWCEREMGKSAEQFSDEMSPPRR